jgi:hypothetical protein
MPREPVPALQTQKHQAGQDDALLADTEAVAAALHTTGALDDGTPLD